jgi:uncharacterized membrane protein YcaP (DUF421 family)
MVVMIGGSLSLPLASYKVTTVQDYTFDLQRILFGDLPPLFIVEIALRTTIMLFYLLLLLRVFMGKRSLAQFSLLEFLLIIALGSAVGDPMFYPEIPVLHGMVVITVVVLLERLLIWMTNRNHRLEDVFEGSPQSLVVEGRFDLNGLKKSSLSRNEIYMKLRLAGIEQLGQVRRSYLELNGEISVFKVEANKVRPGLPLFPELELGEVQPLTVAAPLPKAGDFACLKCGEVIALQAGQLLPACPRCHQKQWVEADHTEVRMT